jgi:hypothetical protein
MPTRRLWEPLILGFLRPHEPKRLPSIPNGGEGDRTQSAREKILLSALPFGGNWSNIHFMKALTCVVLPSLLVVGSAAHADSVEMRNGDRYVGSVVSVDTRTVTLLNPNLGTLRLPRTNVAQISFVQVAARTEAKTNVTAAAVAVTPGVVVTPSSANTTGLQQLRTEGLDPKLKQEIQAQFLSAAGPEANAKFDAMVQGLMTGSMSMGDLRAEAQSAANQIRALRKDVGGEGGEVLDSYLEVLDGFIKQSQGEATKTPAPAVRTAPATPQKTAPR